MSQPALTLVSEEKLDPQEFNLAETGAAIIGKEANALFRVQLELMTPDTRLYLAFNRAINEIVNLKGKVIVTGMGKSGYIAHKLAATLSSTGTTAVFVHPAEASHGDLGTISKDDAVIALSNSGKSQELSAIIRYSKRFGIPLIAITSDEKSPLGRAANISLLLPNIPEACPLRLAPMTSTTMTLALGDALAGSIMKAKGFTSADFGKYHPGGSLGNQLQKVEEVMITNGRMPLVTSDVKVSETLTLMAEKGFGCAGVISKRGGKLIGVVTYADVHRHKKDMSEKPTANLMTRNPETIAPSTLTAEALNRMEQMSVAQLFVVDDMKRPIGVVRVHDLLKAGVA